MATLHTNPPRPAPEAGPHDPPSALPDWLTALDQPAVPATNGTGTAADVTPPDTAPSSPFAAAPSANETTSSLVDESDLPAWLKALSMPEPEPVPPVAEASPAWLNQTAAPASTPTHVAPKAAEVPQIWNTRPARQEADATHYAPIFASLDAATVSGSPAEVEAPSAASAEATGVMWWRVLGAVALLVLVLVAILLWFVFMR